MEYIKLSSDIVKSCQTKTLENPFKVELTKILSSWDAVKGNDNTRIRWQTLRKISSSCECSDLVFFMSFSSYLVFNYFKIKLCEISKLYLWSAVYLFPTLYIQNVAHMSEKNRHECGTNFLFYQ